MTKSGEFPTASVSYKRSHEPLQHPIRSLYGALLDELSKAQEQGRFCLTFNHPGLQKKNLFDIIKLLQQQGYEAVGEMYVPSHDSVIVITIAPKIFTKSYPASNDAKTDTEKFSSLSPTGYSLYITWGTDEEILYSGERIPFYRKHDHR